mmetsp:Transcript_20041/g.46665  ORF Transcript_20041/g.46665 Transcript_20041/m.46665 type:complete len:213 (+) Transcript_20041:623-1261(+)
MPIAVDVEAVQKVPRHLTKIHMIVRLHRRQALLHALLQASCQLCGIKLTIGILVERDEVAHLKCLPLLTSGRHHSISGLFAQEHRHEADLCLDESQGQSLVPLAAAVGQDSGSPCDLNVAVCMNFGPQTISILCQCHLYLLLDACAEICPSFRNIRLQRYTHWCGKGLILNGQVKRQELHCHELSEGQPLVIIGIMHLKHSIDLSGAHSRPE